MKINVAPATTDVSSIKEGNCFILAGVVYMRVRNSSDIERINTFDYIPVVDLRTGIFDFIKPDTQVDDVDCTVVNTPRIPQNTPEEKGKWDV